jgi:hypothetical protein
MLERATRRLAGEDEEVASRVRLVETSGEAAPEALGGAVYDAVPDRAATDPEDLVLQAELMASQRDPYRRLSRVFHLVGRRPE